MKQRTTDEALGAESTKGFEPAAADAQCIARWLTPAAMDFFVGEARRKPVLMAAAKLAEPFGLMPTLVFDALWRREQAASTALGHGFALPHARIDGIAEPITLYVRSSHPVLFNAPDGEAVSHFIVILVPRQGAGNDHLRLLAATAQLASSRSFRNQLSSAEVVTAAAEAFRSGIARLVFDF